MIPVYSEDHSSIFDACLAVWESERPELYGQAQDAFGLDEDGRKEYWASLALKHSRGIGPRTWRRLLQTYGGAYPAVMDAGSWLRRRLVREDQAAVFSTQAWREPAREEWDAFWRRRDGLLLWTDLDYPARLREIPDPPLFLYYTGRRELLGNPGVAVVGPRRCTQWGKEFARGLCRDLSRAGVTVVSGMAWGIDREAHLAGLEEVGGSIAVLGTGLDMVYPRDNLDVWRLLLQQGLALTEFGPGGKPLPQNFPRRNRIISGLSLAVVVAEGTRRSGGLITARLAVEHGREVFCAPGDGSAAFSGCLEFIEQGAHPVNGALDVVMELGPLLKSELRDVAPVAPPRAGNSAKTKKDSLASLNPDQKAVMVFLHNSGRAHPDDIAAGLEWDAGRVSRVLLDLELQGMAQQSPGMVYRPTT